MEKGGKTIYLSNQKTELGDGSFEKPFHSFGQVRDRLIKEKDNQGGFTIVLRGGDYKIDSSILLDSVFSGTREHPNEIIAYEGEEVRFLGGVLLSREQFLKVNNPEVLKQFSEKARTEIYQLDLMKANIDFGQIRECGHSVSVTNAPIELFYDHQPMKLARYPNTGYIRLGEIVDSGSVPRIGDYSSKGGSFKYTDLHQSAWKGIDDVWLCGTFHNGYADDMLPIESIDTENQVIKLKIPHLYGLKSGRDFIRYYAENILQELDVPGEWYADRENKIIYFYFPDQKNKEIAISILEQPMLYIKEASYLTVKGVSFEYGRAAGIIIEGGEEIHIEDCTVCNVGTCGIFMGKGAKQTFPHNSVDDYEGVPVSGEMGNYLSQLYTHTLWEREAGKNHIIKNCNIYFTGSGGVCLSGGSKRNLVSGNNQVVHCTIHDYNRRNKFCFSGVNVDGCGNSVIGCEVYNSDFQAFYLRGNNHVFEYNNVHHVTQDSDDTSAWYLGRDLTDRGNKIRFNYFHEIGRLDRDNRCIYLDDSTADVEIYGNVFYHCDTIRGLLYCNGARDVRVENNIAIDCPVTFVEQNSYFYTWATHLWGTMFGKDGIGRKRLKEVNYDKPPYSTAYPELKGILEPIGKKEVRAMRSENNIMRNNVLCYVSRASAEESGNLIRGNIDSHVSNTVTLSGKYAQFDEESNLVYKGDVGFEEYKTENFKLRHDSIVFQKLKSFREIPWELMK